MVSYETTLITHCTMETNNYNGFTQSLLEELCTCLWLDNIMLDSSRLTIRIQVYKNV